MDDWDALRLTFTKDALLAEFQTRASLWEALQVASVTAIPVATVAHLANQLSWANLQLVLLTASGVAFLAGVVLYVNRRLMERDLKALLAEIERLKHRGR